MDLTKNFQNKYVMTLKINKIDVDAIENKEISEKKSEPIYSTSVQSDTVNEDQNAVDKITEKYDSLGKVKNQEIDITPIEETKDLVNALNILTMRDEITEQDLAQVEIFFRSHKTRVVVCNSMANLYFTTIENLNEINAWQLTHSGIPVLLLDTGETRSRVQKKLQLILAERGTGFILWKDIIDDLTSYKALEPNFHTMLLSDDHRKVAGFCFENSQAATEFLHEVEIFTSDPENVSLSNAKKNKKKKKVDKKLLKIKLPKKSDISQPCCFQHVTKLDSKDSKNYYTLSMYLQNMDDDNRVII